MIDDDLDDQYFYRGLFSDISPELDFDSITSREELNEKIFQVNSGSYKLPKLILLDLNLPKISGKEIFLELASHVHFNSIPIVALTTSSSPLDIQDCKNLGFNAYFVKPSEFEDCKDLVKTLHSYWFVMNEINNY